MVEQQPSPAVNVNARRRDFATNSKIRWLASIDDNLRE